MLKLECWIGAFGTIVEGFHIYYFFSINAKIPFISVPLPTSADNHQLKNAIYYEKKNFSFLIEEKDLNNKLFYLIKSIYEDRHLLDKIKFNQRQFSDKNVFNNINKELNKIFNEKN